MGPRKYYHHVERDPENIKSIWKVLHTSTFVLIILNSLISAYIFGDILKMFNYRCILHIEPIFGLTQITYLNNNTQIQINLREDKLKTEENTTEEFTTTFQPENVTKITLNERAVDTLDSSLSNSTNYTQFIDWSKAGIISESLKHVYIINDTFWYKNDSEYGKINVHIRGSDYGSTTSCDLVLFVPLISLISAAAFGALIMLFGRGQQSQRSWVIVYPVLIASAIMTILSIIALISMKNGVEDFCSHFQDYTGESKCSRYISLFTFQGKLTLSDFWDDYILCYYSFILTLLLWTIQMVVTILRLGSLADFHFVTVSVEKSEINVDEEFDEKIHNALLNSGMKPLNHKSLQKDDSNLTNEKSDESTTV